jgi:hypothetical protein
MEKKCLIVFSSFSGNTAKVADRFKSTFEKNGWECDMFRIGRNFDYMNPPFEFKDYNFVCIGSGLNMHLPSEEILNTIQKQFYQIDPKIFKRSRYGEVPMPPEGGPPPGVGNPPRGKVDNIHRKIVLTGEKLSVIFVTYAGYEFGPKEAEPAMQLLELEIAHQGFECIGHFCCPGKMGNEPLPGTYHGDITHRPDERDLLRAEMFIEDMLEKIAER